MAEKSKPMKVYHVTKRAKDDKWTIKIEGSTKVIKLFDSRDEASVFCEQLAENQDALLKYHASHGPNKGRIIEVYNSRTQDPSTFSEWLKKSEEEEDELAREEEIQKAEEAKKAESVKEEKKASAKKAEKEEKAEEPAKEEKKEEAPKAEKKPEPKAEEVKKAPKAEVKEAPKAEKKAPAKKEAKPLPKAQFNRLREKYLNEVKPALMDEFKYESVMQIPSINKVVINLGVGDALQDAKRLEEAVSELATITGQKPIITKAKKSVAAFKLREGQEIGCKVTLRGQRMYEFLDKLISISLPRVRDFRGVSRNAFDGRGNYTLGVKEQLIFPEIDYDKVQKVRGMDIVIVTTALTDKEAYALLEKLGMPFQR